MTDSWKPRTLSGKIIIALLLVGLLTPIAGLINDVGRLYVYAVLWTFSFHTVELYSRFNWNIQSISSIIMWIWKFIYLYIFIQFYNRKMSLRQVTFGAVLAQDSWIVANIGIFLNYLYGGRITYLAIPIPFLVFVSLVVLRIWPRSVPPKTWLEEEHDASWGPTIDINSGENDL